MGNLSVKINIKWRAYFGRKLDRRSTLPIKNHSSRLVTFVVLSNFFNADRVEVRITAKCWCVAISAEFFIIDIIIACGQFLRELLGKLSLIHI